MLRERLITAVVLVSILVLLLSLQQSVYFAIFCVIASGLTLAEWWRISLDKRFTKVAFAVAGVLTVTVIYLSFNLVTRINPFCSILTSILQVSRVFLVALLVTLKYVQVSL